MFISRKTHLDRQTFADMASNLDLFSSVLTSFYLITFPRKCFFRQIISYELMFFDVTLCPLINVIPEGVTPKRWIK